MSHSIHRQRTLFRGAALLTLVLSTGACSAIRFGGPDHDVGGTWEGSVTVQGERIPGSLAVEQDGFLLHAAFAAPSYGINATGDGEIDDDGVVRLELEYDLQCPGTAVLHGTLSGEDTVLSGNVEATDCTGTAQGTFRFVR